MQLTISTMVVMLQKVKFLKPGITNNCAVKEIDDGGDVAETQDP